MCGGPAQLSFSVDIHPLTHSNPLQEVCYSVRSYGLFQVFMPITIVCNATYCYLLLRYPWLLFTFRTTRAFVGGCALTSVACGMVLLQAYSCCATYLWTRGRECRPQVCLPFDAYKLTQERVHGRQHQHSYMYVYGWWGGAGEELGTQTCG